MSIADSIDYVLNLVKHERSLTFEQIHVALKLRTDSYLSLFTTKAIIHHLISCNKLRSDSVYNTNRTHYHLAYSYQPSNDVMIREED